MWIQLVLLVVSLAISALSYALMPSKKSNNATATEITSDDIDMAEEGNYICAFWGERWIQNPNVILFGNVYTSPIKSSGGGDK